LVVESHRGIIGVADRSLTRTKFYPPALHVCIRLETL
jgi:hypothetical protein